MTQKIQQVILVFCAVVIGLLAVIFFVRARPIEVKAPELTKALLEENRTLLEAEEQKRQNAEAARRRAELEKQLYQCTADEQCIIVDKNPCGCLKGPDGVVAINSMHVMGFSRMMEKQFKGMVSCPSVASTIHECSPKARPVCDHGHCRIVY